MEMMISPNCKRKLKRYLETSIILLLLTTYSSSSKADGDAESCKQMQWDWLMNEGECKPKPARNIRVVSKDTPCNATVGQCTCIAMNITQEKTGCESTVVKIHACVASVDELSNPTKKEMMQIIISGAAKSMSNVTVHHVGKNSTKFLFHEKRQTSAEVLNSNGVAEMVLATATPSGKSVDLSGYLSTDGRTVFIGENTSIVSVSLYDSNFAKIKTAIRLTIDTAHDFSLQTKFPADVYVKSVSKVCAVYNKSSRWDASVCETKSFDAESIVCDCDHNSAFAVVFIAKPITIEPKLIIACQALEVISILFLFATSVILIVHRKKTRSFDRVIVEINLCVALFFMHLFFVVGPSARYNKVACRAVTFLSHLFLLASAVLMVAEGSLMIGKMLAPHFFGGDNAARKRRCIAIAVAWIIPLLLASLCCYAGINFNYIDAYRGGNADQLARDGKPIYEKCWIGGNLLNYFVVVPVAIALTINLCIAVRLAVMVWNMSRSAEKFKPSHEQNENKVSHAVKALRAVVFLLPVLGLPWILGFLAVIDGAETPFIIMHNIVNGLQGVMIFFLYIIYSSEMRTILKNSWNNKVNNSSFLPPILFTHGSSMPDSLRRNETQVAPRDTNQQTARD